MLENGGANVQTSFADINKGQVISALTTPAIYLSFFDPQRVVDIRSVLPVIQRRVLWIAGKDDHLNEVYKTRSLFNLLPANRLTRYTEIPGSHVGVMRHSAPEIVRWIQRS